MSPVEVWTYKYRLRIGLVGAGGCNETLLERDTDLPVASPLCVMVHGTACAQAHSIHLEPAHVTVLTFLNAACGGTVRV